MGKSRAAKERKRIRTEKRREREKEYIEGELARGRLMWENNNGQDFSPEFLLPQVRKLLITLSGVIFSRESLLTWVRFHRDFIRDVILRWPSSLPHSPSYQILKRTIEYYWDYGPEMKDDLIRQLKTEEVWEDLMDYKNLRDVKEEGNTENI